MKAIRQLIKQGDGLLKSGGALEAGTGLFAVSKAAMFHVKQFLKLETVMNARG